MLGDAVPIRFSRRIGRKASLSPIKASAKKVVRRFARKASGLNLSLIRDTKKAKVGRKSKSKKNSRKTSKILKQASANLKAATRKSTSKNRKQTRSSLIRLPSQNVSVRLYGKSKNVNEKKHLTKSLDNKKEYENNRGKAICTPRYSERIKSSRLSAELLNQKISLDMHASKSLVNPDHEKVTRSSGKKENIPKKSSRSKTLVPEVHISASKSYLETPAHVKVMQTSKRSFIRKSSRLLELSPLKTLNQELSLSTPNPLNKKNLNSMVNKSSKSVTSGNFLQLENRGSKRGNYKISSKKINSDSHEKVKGSNGPLQKHLTRKSSTSSVKETSENFKKSFSNVTENLSFDILTTTPSLKLADSRSTSVKCLSKSNSKSSNRLLDILTTESPVVSKKLSSKSLSSPMKVTRAFTLGNGRKSSRLVETPSPLKTLNQELSLSAPEPTGRKNPNSIVSKSSKSDQSSDLLFLDIRGRKRGISKVSNKKIGADLHEKLKKNNGQKQKHLIRKSSHLSVKDTPKNFKRPFSNETENLPFDILTTTPSFKLADSRSISMKCLSKSNSKSSNRLLDILTTGSHVSNEKLLDAKKRKKSAGDNICVDGSTNTTKLRRIRKSIYPAKTDYSKRLENKDLVDCQYQENDLTAETGNSLSRRRIVSVPLTCDADHLSSKRKKSTCNLKRKMLNKKQLAFINTTLKRTYGKKSYLPQTNLTKTADSYKVKHSRTKSVPLKKNKLNDSWYEKQRSATNIEKRVVRTLAPINLTRVSNGLSSENQSMQSSMPNSVTKNISQLPVDSLTTCSGTFNFHSDNERLLIKMLTPCIGNKHSLLLGDELSKEKPSNHGIVAVPTKGTLKRKRWLLNNLKEKSEGYEDDIFESQNFDFYKPAFHFGDESDGSSVNIATPKFDCILTPALPKKTPRFKDCISPTELLQTRKSAEEYLYRRNKKRKSGEGPSSSGKKTSTIGKNTSQSIPEKKKLDFEEAVNKLIEVQKNLEQEAEVDNEEEDSYFSDTSN